MSEGQGKNSKLKRESMVNMKGQVFWSFAHTQTNKQNQNMVAITKAQMKFDADKAIESLKIMLHIGATVYTIVRHVSSSGMSRNIQCLIMHVDGDKSEIRDISHWVARALGWPLADNGVRVAGCGMDMAFHLVNSLAYTLYNDGYALKKERI